MIILNLLHFRSTNKLWWETTHSIMWSFYAIILIICPCINGDFDDKTQDIDYKLIKFFLSKLKNHYSNCFWTFFGQLLS